VLTPEQNERAQEARRLASELPSFEARLERVDAELADDEEARRHARELLVSDRAREIFREALDVEPFEERLKFAKRESPNEEVWRQVRTWLRTDARQPSLPRPVARPATPSEPDAIGPYLIEHELGRGGMGIVFRARHERTGQPAAVKVMRGRLLSTLYRERFKREVKALETLRHPNIVPLLAIDFAEDLDGLRPYMAMEFVEGRDLAAYAATEEVGEDERLRILEDLCDAIQYVHERGVIHRDLKPSNVLVDASGQPWLLDFGVAHLDEQTRTLTQAGQRFGTPQYMSPELAEGSPVDGRSDVYSLGVLGFELLTGRVPYDVPTGSVQEMMDSIGTLERRPLREIAPDLPRPVARALDRAMARRREDRWQTAAELGTALRRYRVAKRQDRRLDRIAVGGAAALAVAAGLWLAADRMLPRPAGSSIDPAAGAPERVAALSAESAATLAEAEESGSRSAYARAIGTGHEALALAEGTADGSLAKPALDTLARAYDRLLAIEPDPARWRGGDGGPAGSAAGAR
jgi:predicted Ser/Thr protein kinase